MGKSSTNGGYTLSNNVTYLCHNLYLHLYPYHLYSLYPFLMLELHGAGGLGCQQTGDCHDLWWTSGFRETGPRRIPGGS